MTRHKSSVFMGFKNCRWMQGLFSAASYTHSSTIEEFFYVVFFFFYKSVCFQSKSTVTVTHFLIHLTDPPCVTTDRRLSTHTNIMQCVVQAVITTKKVGSDRSDSGADPCGAADSSNSSMKVLCSAGDGLLSAKRLFWQSGSLCCRAVCFRLGR